MALFIEVEIDSELGAEEARKLAEVCPVDIFELRGSAVRVVESNLDECTLCELCLGVGRPGQVRVKKLYDGGSLLRQTAS